MSPVAVALRCTEPFLALRAYRGLRRDKAEYATNSRTIKYNKRLHARVPFSPRPTIPTSKFPRARLSSWKSSLKIAVTKIVIIHFEFRSQRIYLRILFLLHIFLTPLESPLVECVFPIIHYFAQYLRVLYIFTVGLSWKTAGTHLHCPSNTARKRKRTVLNRYVPTLTAV